MTDQLYARVLDYHITTYCTLNCKLCMTGTPYITNRFHISIEEFDQQLSAIFKIWDTAMRLNLVGGEPLLHPNIYELVQVSLKYQDYFQSLRITTNGTIVPESRLFELIATCGKGFDFVVSNYGPLSKNLKPLVERLTFYNIPYRVDTYAGDQQHFGGWVDLGDYEYIGYSEDELQKQYSECVQVKDQFLDISDGKVFQCAFACRAFTAKGITPETEEYIDLYDESSTIAEKREIAGGFFTKPMKACRYCRGFNERTSKRYPAAEQI